MRRSGSTPSIVPDGDDQNVYLVVDDFGRNGRAWREADVEATDLETVILDLLEGQYKNPVRVVGFNTAEGWSQDVSADIFPSGFRRPLPRPIPRRSTAPADPSSVRPRTRKIKQRFYHDPD